MVLDTVTRAALGILVVWALVVAAFALVSARSPEADPAEPEPPEPHGHH
ncbi:MAG: hypothetical protein JSV80_01450 [Acidobacteriota bacterium]|nr:MAG: hypothetical protein JSV80_01450 [Acidobacteriota bacterium]